MLINNKNLIKTIKRVDLTTEQETNLNEISNIKNDLNNIKNTELENLNTAINTLETLVGLDETVGDKSGLPSGDENVIASINRIDSKQSGTVTDEQISTAVNNYLTEHPVSGGATEEQVAQIQANKTAIGDSNSGLIKEVNDIKNTELQNLNTAIQTLETLVGDKTNLPSGDANVIASINRINNTIGTEELPTTAKTLKGAIAETFQNVSNGKTLIASAITDKGVATSNTDTFQTMANNIKSIQGTSTSDNINDYIEGRTLLWEDDFEGTELNLNNWTYEIGNMRKPSACYYTDSTNNVRVENSELIFSARRESITPDTAYTSGSITTNDLQEFGYGRYEAKIKFPCVAGEWGAFWLMGNGYNYDYQRKVNNGTPWPLCGETDIVEHWDTANYGKTAMHHQNDSGSLSSTEGVPYTPKADLTQYHIYACERTETDIAFFFDGIEYHRQSYPHDSLKSPQFILLNMAVSGIPDELETFEMKVDWVRVYAPKNLKHLCYEKIVYDKSNIEVKVGEKIKINKTLTPTNVLYNTLTYSCDNEEIATFKGDYVRGISEGTCKGTVVSPSGASAFINIKVTPSKQDTEANIYESAVTSYMIKNSSELTNPYILPTTGNDNLMLSGFDSSSNYGLSNGILHLDGINDYVYVDNLDISKDKTIQILFKLNDFTKSSTLLEIGGAICTLQPQNNVFKVASSSLDYFYDNKWHVLTFTYNHTSNWTRYYIDDKEMHNIGRTLTNSKCTLGSLTYSNYASIDLAGIFIYDELLSNDNIKKSVNQLLKDSFCYSDIVYDCSQEVNDGEELTLSIKLSKEPMLEQTVTVTTDYSNSVVNNRTLIFNKDNYNIYQTVTISTTNSSLEENKDMNIFVNTNVVDNVSIPITIKSLINISEGCTILEYNFIEKNGETYNENTIIENKANPGTNDLKYLTTDGYTTFTSNGITTTNAGSKLAAGAFNIDMSLYSFTVFIKGKSVSNSNIGFSLGDYSYFDNSVSFGMLCRDQYLKGYGVSINTTSTNKYMYISEENFSSTSNEGLYAINWDSSNKQFKIYNSSGIKQIRTIWNESGMYNDGTDRLNSIDCNLLSTKLNYKNLIINISKGDILGKLKIVRGSIAEENIISILQNL